MNIQLLLIDPQNDFCSPPSRTPWNLGGSLYVPGADKDMTNTAMIITKLTKILNNIHVTLDTHNTFHIFHPSFWVDDSGLHPSPFTIIRSDDIKHGRWTFSKREYRHTLSYVQELESNDRPLCIWPEHCRIGTWGHNIYSEVSNALLQWEEMNLVNANYIQKGSSVISEQFSAMPNSDLGLKLSSADLIPFAGEALSHCVSNTITDIVSVLGRDSAKKFVYLSDCSGNVPGFEQNGKRFVDTMLEMGMQECTASQFIERFRRSK